MQIHEQFLKLPEKPVWNRTEINTGNLHLRSDETLELSLSPIADKFYSNAQIATYGENYNFLHNPPLRMTVRARAQGMLQGTAGFGFWNHPFDPTSRRLDLPQALWFFFAAPPNNMKLAQRVDGHGWKTATFNAKRWQFLSLLPTAPIGFLLMRIPIVYRNLWSIGQKALSVHEKALSLELLQEWHEYRLEWLPQQVRFYVDDELIHSANFALSAPLGFVAWADNQYAIVTPQGQFKFGFVEVTHNQSLLLDFIEIQPL